MESVCVCCRERVNKESKSQSDDVHPPYVDYSITNAPPANALNNATQTVVLFSELAAAIYPSPGPYIPPEPVAPGTGAPSLAPASTVVGAVGNGDVFDDEDAEADCVMVEFDVAVLLPVADAAAVVADCVMVKTNVWVEVLSALLEPMVITCENDVESTTVALAFDVDAEADADAEPEDYRELSSVCSEYVRS